MKTHKETCEELKPAVVAEVAPEVYEEYGGGALLAEDAPESASSSSSSSDAEDSEDDDDAPPAVSAGAGRSVVSTNANDAKKGVNVLAKGKRLTWDIATDVRRRSEEGETIDEIAEAIGAHPCAVRRIVRGETWVVKKTAGTGEDGFVRDNIRLVAHVPSADEIAEMKRKKTAPKVKKEKVESEKRTREFYKNRIAELEAALAEETKRAHEANRRAEAAEKQAEMAENARRAIIEGREDAEADAMYHDV